MRFIQATAALMIVASMIVVSAGSSLAQQSHKYRASLSRLPLDNVLQRTVTGKGAVTAELAGQRLTITGTFEGLTKAATIANVHVKYHDSTRPPAVWPLHTAIRSPHCIERRGGAAFRLVRRVRERRTVRLQFSTRYCHFA